LNIPGVRGQEHSRDMGKIADSKPAGLLMCLWLTGFHASCDACGGGFRLPPNTLFFDGTNRIVLYGSVGKQIRSRALALHSAPRCGRLVDRLSDDRHGDSLRFRKTWLGFTPLGR